MDINHYNNYNENQRVENNKWQEQQYGRQAQNSYNLHHNKNHDIFDDPQY